MSRGRMAALLASAAAALLLFAASWLAPYVYSEISTWRQGRPTVSPTAPKLAKGRMIDDYFAVEELAPGTFAIGEPRYYQGNYSYLIAGQKRALLFDAGSGSRNMRQTVGKLTDLPVTVIPSHLHYDHLGGIGAFDHVALVDLPETRARVANGRFVPGRYQFLGMFDGLPAPHVKVAEWIKPGTVIDLGGRSVQLLSTPGHTPESVSLFERSGHRLFTGDFIYPTTLYAFLPGANLTSYRSTARRLLATLPADTRLWAAHCCRREEGFAAPWLTMRDLADLDRALGKLDDGTLRKTEGFFPRRYKVNAQMDIATAFPWSAE